MQTHLTCFYYLHFHLPTQRSRQLYISSFKPELLFSFSLYLCEPSTQPQPQQSGTETSQTNGQAMASPHSSTPCLSIPPPHSSTSRSHSFCCLHKSAICLDPQEGLAPTVLDVARSPFFLKEIYRKIHRGELQTTYISIEHIKISSRKY